MKRPTNVQDAIEARLKWEFEKDHKLYLYRTNSTPADVHHRVAVIVAKEVGEFLRGQVNGRQDDDLQSANAKRLALTYFGLDETRAAVMGHLRQWRYPPPVLRHAVNWAEAEYLRRQGQAQLDFTETEKEVYYQRFAVDLQQLLRLAYDA